ncbi:MAG: hypothetical protein GY705_05195 [Bacteroidetes bacterium]|nr:hypothetical protein [Bacteroidota bacterium]
MFNFHKHERNRCKEQSLILESNEESINIDEIKEKVLGKAAPGILAFAKLYYEDFQAKGEISTYKPRLWEIISVSLPMQLRNSSIINFHSSTCSFSFGIPSASGSLR